MRTPPKNEHLNAFDADLYDMVRNIEFKTVSPEFQSNLSKGIKRINEDPLLFIPADKTNNLYKLSKDNCNKLLTDNITNSYKKTNTAAINNINKEAKCITERLHLDDRVEKFNRREAFVTLKDHKENFQKYPKFLARSNFLSTTSLACISGSTSIVLFSQEKPLWWTEIHTHTHTHTHISINYIV